MRKPHGCRSDTPAAHVPASTNRNAFGRPPLQMEQGSGLLNQHFPSCWQYGVMRGFKGEQGKKKGGRGRWHFSSTSGQEDSARVRLPNPLTANCAYRDATAAFPQLHEGRAACSEGSKGPPQPPGAGSGQHGHELPGQVRSPLPRRGRLGPLPAGTGLGEGRRRPQEKEVRSPPPPPPPPSPASTAEEPAKPPRGPGAAPRLPPALTCRAAGQHPPARGPPSSGARRKGVARGCGGDGGWSSWRRGSHRAGVSESKTYNKIKKKKKKQAKKKKTLESNKKYIYQN